MKFWEMEFCCQECYSGPLFSLPLENKSQFYMLMDLITARRSEPIGKSQAAMMRGDSLLSSAGINLEFSNLWLVYLLVLILEVHVNRVLLWIWGLISLYLFAYLLISPIHNCMVLTFKTPPYSASQRDLIEDDIGSHLEMFGANRLPHLFQHLPHCGHALLCPQTTTERLRESQSSWKTASAGA